MTNEAEETAIAFARNIADNIETASANVTSALDLLNSLDRADQEELARASGKTTQEIALAIAMAKGALQATPSGLNFAYSAFEWATSLNND
jgi:hypothetical protein